LRILLLLTGLLVGLVPTNQTSGSSAQNAMVAGKVTGDPADRGAFQAALGLRRQAGPGDESNRDGRDSEFAHLSSPERM
jgi:hypothetical protein